MPRRKKHWLDTIFELLFGKIAPLAQYISPHNGLYLYRGMYILCEYVVARLFEPTDKVVSYLHVIDSYGTLLLLAGFSVWITVDIILLIRKHLGDQHDEDEDQDRR